MGIPCTPGPNAGTSSKKRSKLRLSAVDWCSQVEDGEQPEALSEETTPRRALRRTPQAPGDGLGTGGSPAQCLRGSERDEALPVEGGSSQEEEQAAGCDSTRRSGGGLGLELSSRGASSQEERGARCASARRSESDLGLELNSSGAADLGLELSATCAAQKEQAACCASARLWVACPLWGDAHMGPLPRRGASSSTAPRTLKPGRTTTTTTTTTPTAPISVCAQVACAQAADASLKGGRGAEALPAIGSCGAAASSVALATCSIAASSDALASCVDLKSRGWPTRVLARQPQPGRMAGGGLCSHEGLLWRAVPLKTMQLSFSH